MMNLFANSSSNWVKYDKYEWKKAEQSGVMITFIHYEHPSNLEPIGMYFEDEVPTKAD